MRAVLTVQAHKPDDTDVYLDPQLLPGSREGDIAELWCPTAPPRPQPGAGAEGHDLGPDVLRTAHKSHRRASTDPPERPGGIRDGATRTQRRNLYFTIRAPPATMKAPPATVSVSSSVLGLLQIRPRAHVHVRTVSASRVEDRVQIDVLELHFKGVYLTRNDQYRIAKQLTGCCVYSGQRVTYLNDLVRLSVDSIFKHGRKRFSGFVGDDTRLVFRSDSSRMLVFIQMSSEMWNFDETGDIMFHRLVNSFIPEMLHRWHTQGDSHLVSVILFTSVAAKLRPGNSTRLAAGVLEKDTLNFYRVVVDSVHISRWSDIMRTLRREFERFPEEVLVNPDTNELRGYFLPSSKSNILEAVSLATTLLTHKFLDKDLGRTGLQALIVTPGPACFDVDLSDLYAVSKRLLGVEIGIELVCLARPPLHVTPLFRALLPALGDADTTCDQEYESVVSQPPDTRSVYCVPTWINMSFWSTQDRYVKQWIPRCKIYDLQMVGLIENEARSVLLRSSNFKPSDVSLQFMRAYDAGVFKSAAQLDQEKRIEAAAKNSQSSGLRPAAFSSFAKRSAATATPSLVHPEVAFSEPELMVPADVTTSPNRTTANSQAPARRSLGALLKSAGSGGSLRPASSRWSLRAPKSASASGSRAATPEQSQDRRQEPRAHVSRRTQSTASALNDIPQLPASPSGDTAVPVASAAARYRRNASPAASLRGDLVGSATRGSLLAVDIPSRKHSQSQQLQQLQLQQQQHKVRWPSSSSPRSTHRDQLNSVERDHHGLSVSPNTPVGAFCEVVRPEAQPVSMWRVLPNPTVIDHPTRLEAFGRWANVYPPERKMSAVSWHSLRAPASLPITSESFPTLRNFRDQYKFQFYDLAVDTDELNVSRLLDEMLCLRMQMGFQIATGHNVHVVEASLPRGNPSRIAPIVPINVADCVGIRIYMTRMGVIHRLAVDSELSVNVQLYTWVDPHSNSMRSPVNQGRTQENLVKTCYDSSYHRINNRFLDMGLEHLNWSLLDQQVGGFDDPLQYPSSANAKYLVAIRYVLVPADMTVVPGYESLNAEESHVEGITRFVRSLLRNRETGPSHDDFIVHFYTGQLAKAVSDVVHDGDNKLLELNRLSKSLSLTDIAAEMRGKMGIPFKDRRWHWKYFREVFLGHDLVVWLVNTFADISTTEEAEEYGRLLMAEGLFKHPEDRHPFIDGHYFYELCQEYANAGTSSDDTTPSETRRDEDQKTVKSEDQQSQPQPAGSCQHQRAKINVSHTFVMNVDPKKVNQRPERVRVSIDRMHNPKNAYHVLVEWLNATPRLVDEMFSGLGRMVSSYGLRMIQVPVADVTGSLEDSPFRSAVIARPLIESFSDDDGTWFHVYILRKLGYTLDIHDRRLLDNSDFEVSFSWGRLNAATPQYIHRTGLVLVQLCTDGSFCITPNTPQLSRAALATNSSSAVNVETETDNLINELNALCNNEWRLRALFSEAQAVRRRARDTQSLSSFRSMSSYTEMPRQASQPSSRQSSMQSSMQSSRQSSIAPQRPLSMDYTVQN